MTETAGQEATGVQARRGRRRRQEGVVISAKQDKTVRVEVEYLVKHPRYGKYLRQRTRVQAHNESNAAKLGDKVEIMECRPISKTKTWRVVRVTERSKE